MIATDYIFGRKKAIHAVGFVGEFKTDNSGVTNSTSVQLPINSGDNDLVIDWGDGNSETLPFPTTVSHDYGTAGTYTITIEGNFSFYYNNSGDRSKIMKVLSFGGLTIGFRTFMGCNNIDLTQVSDIPTSFQANCNDAFSRATNLTFINNVEAWDMVGVAQVQSMFLNTNFQGDIGAWDVSTIQYYKFMFANCANFNADISGWNVSAALEMERMFQGATSFNRPLAGWDIRNVGNMSYFMLNVPNGAYNSQYLADNYSAWSQLPVKNNVPFYVPSKYAVSGQAGRDILTGTYGWTITDNGPL